MERGRICPHPNNVNFSLVIYPITCTMARFLFYLLAAAAAVVPTVSPASLKRRHPMMVVPFSVPVDAEVLDLRTTEHKRADKLVGEPFLHLTITNQGTCRRNVNLEEYTSVKRSTSMRSKGANPLLFQMAKRIASLAPTIIMRYPAPVQISRLSNVAFMMASMRMPKTAQVGIWIFIILATMISEISHGVAAAALRGMILRVV